MKRPTKPPTLIRLDLAITPAELKALKRRLLDWNPPPGNHAARSIQAHIGRTIGPMLAKLFPRQSPRD